MLDYLRKLMGYVADHEDLVSAQSVNIKYYLNDPSTPELVEELASLPSKGKLVFNVKDFTATPSNEKELRAVQCYITIANCLNYVEKAVGTKGAWARCKQLAVLPEAGKDLNAFYDGKQLAFFFDRDPATKQVIFTANSTDIVAHETGHALLDSYRPDLWNVQGLEIWAFHEAFGDILAMVNSMQHETILRNALEETGGDLRKSNVITRLAEEMGKTVYRMTGDGSDKYLRDSSVVYQYSNPNLLPKDGPAEQLVAECHSFGRVFSNMWYEIFCSFFDYHKKQSKEDLEAMKLSRDLTFRIFMMALPNMPRTGRFYESASKALIAVAKAHNPVYHNIVRNVVTKRKMIRPQIRMLSHSRFDDLRGKLSTNDEIFKQRTVTTVRVAKKIELKIGDYVDGDLSILSADGMDLNNAVMEVPADSYYEFDHNGNLVDEIVPDDREIIEASMAAVSHIQAMNKTQNSRLASTKTTMWSVENGKLVRNFAMCGG